MVTVGTGYDAVKRLAKDRPDWLPIVAACYRLAREYGQFAGARVRDDLISTGWPGLVYGGAFGGGQVANFPGLRLLGRYGILQKQYSTRRGNRAYWTMPQPDGVAQALRELAVQI